MNAYRRGGTTQMVLGAIVLVVIVGGILYYISDPFNTRVKAQYDQLTKWTPENIAKDPVNYLNFCEQQTKKAMDDLKADRIAIEQNKAKLESMKEEAGNKVRAGEQALVELKGAYKTAATDDKWPVVWHTQSLDKPALQRQVVNLDKQVRSQKALLSKVEGGLKALEAQVGKIEDARDKAQQQLTEIAANRQLLSVNKLTEDLKERLVSMKGAIQATVNTAAETGPISLDQLVAQSAATVDNAEFDKIMNEK